MHVIPILDAAECERARRLVHGLRPHWVQRAPLPFFTLGAATYMDAAGSRRQFYSDLAARLNPVLHQHFGWLHDAVLTTLARVTGRRVAMAPGLALPGFHVFLAHPAFTQPLASVHFDLQYREHPWSHLGVPDFTHPLSFTLAIALPAAGSGLLTWPQGLDEAWETGRADLDAIARQTVPSLIRYVPGSLVIHDGHLAHQIAPPSRVEPGDERITLQGHGLPCGDVIYVYW